MLKLVLLVIFIGIFGILVLSSLLRGVLSFLFGRARTGTTHTGHEKQNYSAGNNNYQEQAHQKKFGANEGEYVPYEEIKES